MTSEPRKWIISGVEWDVKAGVPIIGIGGNANEFASVRASELIEGSWPSVLLRDECDDVEGADRLVMLKWSFSMRILVLLSSDSVSGFSVTRFRRWWFWIADCCCESCKMLSIVDRIGVKLQEKKYIYK